MNAAQVPSGGNFSLPPGAAVLRDVTRRDLRAIEPTTAELVRHAQRGHEDSYAMLFERFHDEVYRFASRRLGDPLAGQDVAADTLADAFVGLSRFRWNGAPFEAWLYTIARRRIADRYRRRVRLDEPQVLDSPDHATRVAEVERIRILVAALPPTERAVIELRFMEDLSVHETAIRLGKRPSAVRVAQMRALRRLRERIGTDEP